MDDEIRRAESVGKVFALGMRYLQKAVRNKDDKEKADANIAKFWQLCAEAQRDIHSAAVKESEKGYHLLQQINNERNQILEAIVSLENSPAPNATTIKGLKQAELLIRRTYAQVLAAVRNNTEIPTLQKRTIKISRVIVHDEVPEGSLNLSISNFSGRVGKNTVSFTIKIKYPNDTVVATWNGIMPGMINKSVSITGLNKSDDRKRRQLLKSAVTCEIWALKKKLFGKLDESLLGSFSVPMTFWGKVCVYDKTEVVTTPKDNYLITMKAVMREPIVEPVQEQIVIDMHISDAASAPPPVPPRPAARTTPAVPAPTPTPAPAPAPAREKPAQKARETTPAPKTEKPLPVVYLLQDWEWERFISGECLNIIVQQADHAINLYKARGKPPQPGLVEQKAKAEEKLEVIATNCGSGSWSEQMYVGMIKKQIVEDMAKSKELPMGETRTNLINRCQCMRGEIESIMNA